MLQAMDVIMGRVEALGQPLRSAEDCDRVRGEGVGRDNVDKLKEIVRTGAFRRSEQLAQDPHHQAIKLVPLPPMQRALCLGARGRLCQALTRVWAFSHASKPPSTDQMRSCMCMVRLSGSILGEAARHLGGAHRRAQCLKASSGHARQGGC